jgi:hypothetical protein
MTKEIITKELANEWDKLRPKADKPLINSIFVDNTKVFGENHEQAGEINPDFGKLFCEDEEGVKEVDITKAQFFPIKTRIKVNSKWIKAEERTEYYTEEVDDLNHIVVRSHDKEEELATGSFFDLREKFNLKTNDVFYVWYNNRFYRWVMKVGGYKVVKALKKTVFKEPAPHCFKVSKINPRSGEGGIWFNEFEFALGDEISTEAAVGLIKQFNGISEVAEDAKEVFNEIPAPTSEYAE